MMQLDLTNAQSFISPAYESSPSSRLHIAREHLQKGDGLGGYLLDVNPFDQPGVEAYKKNMFALLG